MSSALPPLLVNPLHLVLGDSAAGCVRAACASCGMPGTVTSFSDDLTHGSLADLLSSQWRALITRLDREHPDALIVWSGKNVSDTIFVAMACGRLAGRPEMLLCVRVPEIDGRLFVAMQSPQQLASLYEIRRLLSAGHRVSLAQDIARICDTCGPVRRLEQGRVVGAPIDCYDDLPIGACTADWQAAMRVVGRALGHCDGPNLPGDGFFSERLNFLVNAGHIDATGLRFGSGEYSARLAKIGLEDRV